MYTSREQLIEAYSRLDTATIHHKLASGGLLETAREVAIAELARRDREGEPPLVAPSEGQDSARQGIFVYLPDKATMKIGLYA